MDEGDHVFGELAFGRDFVTLCFFIVYFCKAHSTEKTSAVTYCLGITEQTKLSTLCTLCQHVPMAEVIPFPACTNKTFQVYEKKYEKA